MKRFLVFFLAAFMLSFISHASSNAQTETNKITIKVMTHSSMYNRTNVISKLYMNNHPNVNVVVEKTPLVQDALASVVDESIDVIMASRVLTDQESEAAAKKGVQLHERLIGYGGVVIVTDRSNPVNDLTLNQVRKLLTGEITSWKDIGGLDQPVKVVRTGDTFPGTNVFLENEVLKGAPMAKEATVVPDFVKMMSTVSQTPGSIGFVRIRDAFESSSASDTPVKILKIRSSAAVVAVMPSRENLSSGVYPIKRPYFLYHRPNARVEVANYVDFVLGKGWGSEL